MSRDLPLVSIVVPTFNQAQYLPACVDHCLFQTYPRIELIIVDGGSTDGTKSYLESLPGRIEGDTFLPVESMDNEGQIVRREVAVYPKDRAVRIVTFPSDIGATRTYNEGLSRVSGKYCTYIVGDDIPHPHMIEELVAELERGEADFVYSDMLLVNDEGHVVRHMKMPDYDFENCLARWFHLGVSRLYRTDLHDLVGLMDEAYECANDYDHYLRFAMAGARLHHVPRTLYSIRHHGADRKTGQHTGPRYERLLDESKQCARRARAWLKETRGGAPPNL